MATAFSPKAAARSRKGPPLAENEGRFLDGTPVDVTGWITREQVVDLLGCSVQTLYRHERDGRITPARARKNPDSLRECLVYNPAELARLPRKYRGRIPDEAGELAARCFELFERGHPVRAIVIELRQTPQKITELHTEWLDSGGGDLVVAGEAKEAIAEILGEDFRSVPELIEKLRARLGGGANENA